MIKLPGSSTLGLMNQSRAIALLTFIVAVVTVLAGLYWAQSVVIPLALGILLTTIAAPVVKLIERTGLSRIPSVVALTVVVSAVGLGLGWLIYAQMSQLVAELPQYQENIVAKIGSVRSVLHPRASKSWDRMMESVSKSLHGDEEPQAATLDEKNVEGKAVAAPVAPQDTVWLPVATAVFRVMAEVTGYFALAVVVAIFLLVDREDARNRIIQLIGRGHITKTTKALDDATRRISQFLLMQALINASYGAALGLGLYLLGVKYAILWGVLAAVLRYVPYVGGSIAALFPITQALAQFPSWWPALAIIGLVLLLELIINNFVEPRLFGQSIGVSSVALIVAATFWTFLWGPVGLIMAGPLTVCLVVLGKYVPALSFLNVLLGEESPLETEVVLYQRLLAKDEIETERIMDEAFKEHSLLEVYDSLVFPVAASAGADRENGLLSSDDEAYVINALTDIMSANADPLGSTPPPSETTQQVRLLVVAARGGRDRLGITALLGTLHPAKYQLVQASDKMIGAEIVALAEEEEVEGVCISSLPPGGLSHTKYLCKRLRARLPKVKLFVGHWSEDSANGQGWSGVEADVVVHSLQDMLHQLEAWKPVLESVAMQSAEESNESPKVPRPHLLTAASDAHNQAVQ
jgi:predicted PurR-regulated permease PerM